MSTSHRYFLALTAIVAVLLAAPMAHANPKYAALVIHEETGDILFDKYSNERRYPASLTKMMTLYMLFEAIEAGDIKLTDKLPVSKRASLQPASRLGLARGSSITVEQAIEALVIRSANDVATVVAEKLGGTESKFARMMTQRARQMGMRRTTFRNASGLPDRRQITTARDMAVLSQRVSQDFPQYFHYFSQRSFKWNGRTYTSHNKVVSTFSGADGLKTGYTRASGYNLATSAERDGHRLIGIVLGGRSVRTRDAHMKVILRDAYTSIRKRPGQIKAVHALRPVPTLKPTLAPPAPVPSSAPAKSMAQLAAEATGTPVPTPKTLAIALPAQRETPQRTVEVVTPTEPLDVDSLQTTLAALEASDSADAAYPVGEGDAEPINIRRFSVQIGAYRDEKLALERIRDTESTVRSVALIPGREVRITTNDQGSLYRARFTRMTEKEASAACQALRAQRNDCLVISEE